MRRGIRFAVDVGSVRIGVARSDPDGMLATPVETVQRSPREDGVARVLELLAESEVLEVVVGLPKSLDGRQRQAAGLAREWAQRLARAVDPTPVRLVDERLSTVGAHRAMNAAGRPGRKQRSVVDQVAAVIVLQGALDQERTSGREPGEIVVVSR